MAQKRLLLVLPMALAAQPPPSITLNNGIQMPVLLAGTAGYNDTEVGVAIANAMAGNFTSFQTSDNYGNLAGVGRALQNYPRESFFLASMTTPCVHPAAAPARNVTDPTECEELTTSELHTALEQLNVSAVDLVMLHGPSAPSNDYDGSCSEQACELNAAQWRAYSNFLANGKARSIGVSNFCESCLKCLLADDVIIPAVNEIQYHVGQGPDPTGLVSYTAGLGINVQAYSPLCSGDVINDPDVIAIAEAHGRSAAQVGLRYIVQNAAAGSASIVTAAEDPEYIAEDLDIFDFELTDAEMATLSAKTSPQGERDGRPCWGCGS